MGVQKVLGTRARPHLTSTPGELCALPSMLSEACWPASLVGSRIELFGKCWPSAYTLLVYAVGVASTTCIWLQACMRCELQTLKRSLYYGLQVQWNLFTLPSAPPHCCSLLHWQAPRQGEDLHPKNIPHRAAPRPHRAELDRDSPVWETNTLRNWYQHLIASNKTYRASLPYTAAQGRERLRGKAAPATVCPDAASHHQCSAAEGQAQAAAMDWLFGKRKTPAGAPDAGSRSRSPLRQLCCAARCRAAQPGRGELPHTAR